MIVIALWFYSISMFGRKDWHIYNMKRFKVCDKKMLKVHNSQSNKWECMTKHTVQCSLHIASFKFDNCLSQQIIFSFFLLYCNAFLFYPLPLSPSHSIFSLSLFNSVFLSSTLSSHRPLLYLLNHDLFLFSVYHYKAYLISPLHTCTVEFICLAVMFLYFFILFPISLLFPF